MQGALATFNLLKPNVAEANPDSDHYPSAKADGNGTRRNEVLVPRKLRPERAIELIFIDYAALKGRFINPTFPQGVAVGWSIPAFSPKNHPIKCHNVS